MSEKLFSPAKLTKHLRITGVRSDGMHELESEMVSLSFGDTMEIGEGSGIEILDDTAALSWLGSHLISISTDESNLISRALNLVGERAMVRVFKRIPPGAGLGGGSSNAATVLRYFGAVEPVDKAVLLGADVPFCIKGGRAIARGVGEILEPLPYLWESFVLLLSPFGVSTGEVYANFDLMTSESNGAVNNLEPAAQSCEPRLIKSKMALQSLSGTEPTLAGSGSTYFISGTFADVELQSPPIERQGFRYADVSVDGTRYRIIEACTLPQLD